jgi:hypothetical protein
MFKSGQRVACKQVACGREQAGRHFVENVNAREFGRLSKSHMEMSDHIVVLTAIVGAMVTRASVDYERLEDCVNLAAKRYRAGRRRALLSKASSVLRDLEAMQKALRVRDGKPPRSKVRRGEQQSESSPTWLGDIAGPMSHRRATPKAGLGHVGRVATNGPSS